LFLSEYGNATRLKPDSKTFKRRITKWIMMQSQLCAASGREHSKCVTVQFFQVASLQDFTRRCGRRVQASSDVHALDLTEHENIKVVILTEGDREMEKGALIPDTHQADSEVPFRE
jgi:hypothetical protein